jgi:hypothetical protein
MKIRESLFVGVFAVVLASTCSHRAAAQSAAPTTARVTVTQVKPDMLNEWLDLEKNEVVPAMKKGGQKTRTVYATRIFGNSYEYVAITPFEKYADFDGQSPMIKALGADGAARLNAKMRKCIVSTTSYGITRATDLSNVLEEAMPNMIVTARYRIATGKMAEFENLVKSDVLPVYKKGKTGLIVNRRGAGANPNDVTFSTVYNKFADMDGGPFLTKQLGREGADKLNAKFAGIRNLIDVYVRVRVPDLSF